MIGNDFFLRPGQQQLRQSIIDKSFEDVQADFVEEFPRKIKMLAKWAGEYSWKYGYKVKTAEMRAEDLEYKTKMGVGIFLECEKYNDVRGCIALIMEKAEKVKEENEFLVKKNADFKTRLRELNEYVYYAMFPEEIPLNKDKEEE